MITGGKMKTMMRAALFVSLASFQANTAKADSSPDYYVDEMQEKAAVALMSAPAPLVRDTDKQLFNAIIKISTFPTVLDPKIWQNGNIMKPIIIERTNQIVNRLFNSLRISNLSISAIELFGSNASYEYDEKADFGVHVFLDTQRYTGNVAELDNILKKYNELVELKQEGEITFYGIVFEVTFHATRGPNYQPKRGIGQYSITDRRWIEAPTIQPNHFDRTQMLSDAKLFIGKYNEVVTAYFSNKRAFDCNRFDALDKELSRYRNAGLTQFGSRSTANLTYRMLRRISVNVPDMVDTLEAECTHIKDSIF